MRRLNPTPTAPIFKAHRTVRARPPPTHERVVAEPQVAQRVRVFGRPTAVVRDPSRWKRLWRLAQEEAAPEPAGTAAAPQFRWCVVEFERTEAAAAAVEAVLLAPSKVRIRPESARAA